MGYLTQRAAADASRPSTGGGLLGNLLGDAGQFVTGLTELAGAGLHDIGALGEKLIPGQQSLEKGGFALPRMAVAAPGAFAADIAQRWGPLAKGDLGAFASQVYQHPLFFANDVFMGAGAAGRLATRFAPESRLAEYINKPTFHFAGGGQMGGPMFGTGGGVAHPTLGFHNPLVKAISTTAKKLITDPVDKYRVELGRLQGLADDPAISDVSRKLLQNNISQGEQLLKEADFYGLSRIEKPWVRQFWLNRNGVDWATGRFRTILPRVFQERWPKFQPAFEKALGREKEWVQGHLWGTELTHGERVAKTAEVGSGTYDIFRPTYPSVDDQLRVPMPQDPIDALKVLSGHASDLAQQAWDPRLLETLAAEGQSDLLAMTDQSITDALMTGRGHDLLKMLDDYKYDEAASVSPVHGRLEDFFGSSGASGEERLGFLEHTAQVARPVWRKLKDVERQFNEAEKVNPELLPDLAAEHEAGRFVLSSLWEDGVLRHTDDVLTSATGDLRRALQETITNSMIEDGTSFKTILGGMFHRLRRKTIEDYYNRMGIPDIDRALSDLGTRKAQLVGQLEELKPLITRGKGAAATEHLKFIDGELGGVATKISALRRRAAELKREPLPQGAPPFWNEKTNDWVDVPGSTPLELARQRARQGLHMPVYFPEQSADLIKGKELMYSDAHLSRLNPKRPSGALRYKGRLKEEELNLNVSDAYERRLYEQVLFEEQSRLVEHIAKFGRPITMRDDLMAGEVAVPMNFIQRWLRSNRGINDRFLSRIEDATDPEVAVQQSFEELAGPHLQEALDSFQLENQGANLVAVPSVVMKRLQSHFTRIGGKGLRIAFDTPIAAWRAFILSGSPRWLLNNFIGNIFFLYNQAGFKGLARVARQGPHFLSQMLRATKSPRLMGVADLAENLDHHYVQTLRDTMGENLHSIEPGFWDSPETSGLAVESIHTPITTQAVERLKQTRVARAMSSFSQFNRTVNSAIEDTFRRTSYIDAVEREVIRSGARRLARNWWKSQKELERVAKLGADPVSARRIMDQVNRTMNDYTSLTPLGRKVVRRFIWPFFSFYRHMVKTLALMPFEYADRSAALRGLALVGDDMQNEVGAVPPYAQGAFLLGDDPNKPGYSRFLSARGANPFSGALDPAQLLTSVNPAIKMAVEQATGKSVFTGKPFTDPNVVQPFGSPYQYRVYQDDQGQWHEDLVEKTAPGLLEHFLQQFPQYDMLKDALAGGRTYDTTSLLSTNPVAAAQKGLITDAPGGAARFPVSALGQLGRLSGFSTFSLPVKGYQDKLAEEKKAALREFLRERGG